MGVTDSKAWPEGRCFPFGIPSDYTWLEIGALMRLMDEHGIGQVIETGVNKGDFAAWCMSRCMFDEKLHYLGITGDVSNIHMSIENVIQGFPTASIVRGLPYSDSILKLAAKYIKNSPKVMVFCNGANLKREFACYINILRPGDVIVVSNYISTFTLSDFNKPVKEERLKRITDGWMIHNVRFIAGVVV